MINMQQELSFSINVFHFLYNNSKLQNRHRIYCSTEKLQVSSKHLRGDAISQYRAAGLVAGELTDVQCGPAADGLVDAASLDRPRPRRAAGADRGVGRAAGLARPRRCAGP